VDYDEPARIAEAVSLMGLKFAVITSVNRDDRPDGGAELFAMVIREIRQRVLGCGVEVLIPDFQGNLEAVETVMEARPDVLNHNTETVPRLYRQVRLGARYERSLEVLQHARRVRPETSSPPSVSDRRCL
jgi:lipoic acid synthetase